MVSNEGTKKAWVLKKLLYQNIATQLLECLNDLLKYCYKDPLSSKIIQYLRLIKLTDKVDMYTSLTQRIIYYCHRQIYLKKATIRYLFFYIYFCIRFAMFDKTVFNKERKSKYLLRQCFTIWFHNKTFDSFLLLISCI
jgi:hypothetical protein